MTARKKTDSFAAPFEAAQAKAADTMTKAMKSYEDLAKLGQENFEAVMEANKTAMTHGQALNQQFVAYLQSAAQANFDVFKALTGVKSAKEAIDLQTKHAQATFDESVATLTKLSEGAREAANDVAKPLQDRTKVSLDTLMTKVAA